MAERFVFGPFELDTARGVLKRDGTPLTVGGRALAVLQALLAAKGEVLTKAQLMTAAWPHAVVEEANLAVQVAALRKLLDSPQTRDCIRTVARIGYRFATPVHSEDPVEAAAGRARMAVLPFANLSGDAAQEYFVDGITEDIINALTRFRWFFVIARNSSYALKGIAVPDIARELGVRYVLEGSARRSGSRIRIAVALNDASSASRIWAERYDFDATDIFSVQDQIVEQVVGAIEPELLKSEARLALGRHHRADLDAWELVRKGTYCFHQVARATHLEARELFRRAIARDPESADANVWLARVSAGIVAYGWSADAAADLREGVAAAGDAIRLDEQSPYSHYALAITSAYAGDAPRAIRAAQRALELNPSFALGYLVLGIANLFSGEATSALAPLERGLKLNPHDPQNFVWYNMLAIARYVGGDAGGALQAAERAWDIRPGWRPAMALMAACQMYLGRADRAAGCIEQLRLLPEPTDRLLEPLRQRDPRWDRSLQDMLGQSGTRALP